jgi:hypothetical protein
MSTTFIVVLVVILLHFAIGFGFLAYKLGKKK